VYVKNTVYEDTENSHIYHTYRKWFSCKNYNWRQFQVVAHNFQITFNYPTPLSNTRRWKEWEHHTISTL